MDKTITINQTAVTIKEYNGQRVVTLKDIDSCHGRPDGTARRNFNANKQHLIEGEDFYRVCANEIRTHKIMDISSKAREDITLITESGYLMLVKSFTDDLAWQVQRQLVNSYFRTENKAQSEPDGKTVELQIRQERARAMLVNAQSRLINTFLKNPEAIKILPLIQSLSPVAVESLTVTTLEDMLGTDMGSHLPEVEKTFTAGEIAKEIGVTANMVGRVATKNNLKTEEYGIFVLDKSKHSSKQVQTFRYNEKGKAELERLLEQDGILPLIEQR